jgi:hypothetical protein
MNEAHDCLHTLATRPVCCGSGTGSSSSSNSSSSSSPSPSSGNTGGLTSVDCVRYHPKGGPEPFGWYRSLAQTFRRPQGLPHPHLSDRMVSPHPTESTCLRNPQGIPSLGIRTVTAASAQQFRSSQVSALHSAAACFGNDSPMSSVRPQKLSRRAPSTWRAAARADPYRVGCARAFPWSA